MSYEGDEASLTLVAAEASDQASYLCKVTNKLGSVDSECTLTIQGELEICIDRMQCKPAEKASQQQTGIILRR